MMPKKIIYIVLWGVIILWMGIIYSFSNMNSLNSNSLSQKSIRLMLSVSLRATNKIGLTHKDLNDAYLDSLTLRLNYKTRKLAHMTIYFILALLLVITFKYMHFSNQVIIAFTLAICFLYALSDEAHQIAVIGRTGQFKDVLIDTCGAIFGIMVASFGEFILSLYHRHVLKGS